MLDRAVRQLPQAEFDVVVRYYLRDQDTKSIAAELGPSARTCTRHASNSGHVGDLPICLDPIYHLARNSGG
jgi:FixJ family two-component response regulator